MEFNVIRRLFDDKTIVNPMNPEETFTCKDLVDGKHYKTHSSTDYKVCRKERRLQTQKNTKLRRCFQYRKLAFKCYYQEEDDFVDALIERHQEK
jgi:hypothetical protein